MTSERPRLLVLAVAGLLLSGPVLASTVIPRTLEQLSARAEAIVVGTVGEQVARYDDRHTLIVTHTTIDVEETIAGPPASVLEVSEYGGQVGQRRLVVPDTPRYAEGERVLLFLCRDALGLLRTCGATQGRMLLRAGKDGAIHASGVLAGEPVDQRLDVTRERILAARQGGER